MKQEGRQPDKLGDKLGDKGDKGDREDTPSNKAKQEGRQWETRGKADTPSNKGKQEGTQGETRPREGGHTMQQRETRTKTSWEASWETRPREGGHTIQHRHTCGETMGDNGRQDLGKAGTQDKTLGMRANHPTQAHMREDNGRQRQSREGGRTIQHRHTCGETMGDKGRKDFGKADTPSNKGKQEGKQWETRPQKRGHTIQQREIRRDTRGDKTSGRARFPPSLTPPPPPPASSSHTQLTHTELPHTQLVHTQLTDTQLPHTHTTSSHTHSLLTHTKFTHTQLPHTHNLSTHNFMTHNFLTHTHLTHTHTPCSHTQLVTHNLLSHTTCPHTTYSHTTYSHTTCSHTTCPHTTYSHTTYSHNLSTHDLLTHTQLAHTQLSHTQLGTWRHRPSLCVAGAALGEIDTGLALVARLGLAGAAAVWVAGVALGDIDLHSAWQVWGWPCVALTALGWLWSRALGFGNRRGSWHGRHGTWWHRPSLCVAGVALGDMGLHLPWQVWHLWHWAGSGGALGSGVRGGCLRGRRCTWWHRPSLCVAGVALGDMDLHFAWQAWHLQHWAGSGGALGSGGHRGCLRGRRGTWWHRPSLGDKGRQDLGKADKPSNTGIHVGRQWETRGDKTSGRRTHHPTQAHMWGDNGRQGETRPREGGHTIQHQGGHLKKALRTRNKKALRTRNSTLFGEKLISSTGTEPRNNRKHIVWYLLVNYIQHISPSYSHQNFLYPHQNVFVAKGSCCRSFSWRSNFFTSSRWHCQTKLVHRAHSDSDAFGAKSWLGDLKNWYMVDMVKGFPWNWAIITFPYPLTKLWRVFATPFSVAFIIVRVHKWFAPQQTVRLGMQIWGDGCTNKYGWLTDARWCREQLLVGTIVDHEAVGRWIVGWLTKRLGCYWMKYQYSVKTSLNLSLFVWLRDSKHCMARNTIHFTSVGLPCNLQMHKWHAWQ